MEQNFQLSSEQLATIQQHLPAQYFAAFFRDAPVVQRPLPDDAARRRGIQQQQQQPQPLRRYEYDQWLQSTNGQLRRSYGYNLQFHRDFRLGFGLAGSQERRDKMNKIINGLRDFHDRCARPLVVDLQAPGTGRGALPVCTQPFSIYGAEREGKTNAQFSAQRAALDMGFATVVFVAPTKIAPVVDMHTKLSTAGFENIKSTVADSKLPDGITSDTNYPRILVCAATNPADITEAGKFIRSNLDRGILTVSFVDECDELVMAKPAGKNGHTILCSEISQDGVEVQVTYTDLAKSEKLFRQVVQPYSMLFLITATFSGIHLKEAKFYLDDKPAVFIRVRKSEQYSGVANITRCWDLPEDTNTSKTNIKDLLKLDEPLDRALQCFARRENPHDGTLLTSWLPEDGPDKPPEVRLRGTLFVSLTALVNVDDGALTLSQHICKRLRVLLKDEETPGQIARRPLVICFVGKPRAFTCDNQGNPVALHLPSGSTLQGMVIQAMQHWEDYRFSHTAILGYNLTRRAMTATFHLPGDLQGVLHTPMYAMVCFPKASKLDADSQRLLRVGHDFGAYNMPKDYSIYVACEKSKLDALKNYRKLEEEAFRAQEINPKTMAEFRDNMPVREHGLDGHHLTKRKHPVGSLGQHEPRAKRQRNHGNFQ